MTYEQIFSYSSTFLYIYRIVCVVLISLKLFFFLKTNFSINVSIFSITKAVFSISSVLSVNLLFYKILFYTTILLIRFIDVNVLGIIVQ